MAAIDYTGITDQIETILKADSRTKAARVYVEEEPQIGLADAETGAIAVFMEGRTGAANVQPLAAGKRTRYFLRMSLWVVFFHMESFRRAREGRDTLLGQLELVLMDNRTIGGKVETSWLEGGDMISARSDSGSVVFVSAAETVLVAEVLAVNT